MFRASNSVLTTSASSVTRCKSATDVQEKPSHVSTNCSCEPLPTPSPGNRLAGFGFVSPTYTQSKDVAWEYLKSYSRPFLSETPNESELRVDLWNGSRIRLYGADNPDSLRGLGFDGLVVDEYADVSPSLYPAVLRPALADRKGRCTFIGTVKGRNHLWKTYEDARGDPEFYTALLPASKTGLLSGQELSAARKDMGDAQFNSNSSATRRRPSSARILAVRCANATSRTARTKSKGHRPADAHGLGPWPSIQYGNLVLPDR
jgi:hypothetical protein